MAAGDLTASTPTLCSDLTAIKTHVDTLNLGAATDFIVVVPNGNLGGWVCFKVEREADA